MNKFNELRLGWFADISNVDQNGGERILLSCTECGVNKCSEYIYKCGPVCSINPCEDILRSTKFQIAVAFLIFFEFFIAFRIFCWNSR